MSSIENPIYSNLILLNARCSICGVYDSYYQCDSCNKKFCIDDWDKVYSTNSHQKQRIIFQIIEDSRKILIDFFEKLKSETFNFYKQKIIEASSKNIEIKDKEHLIANIYCNWLIHYLCEISSVSKKLLYFSLDYFLINPPYKAKIYVGAFNFSDYKRDFLYEIVNFVYNNYLYYDSLIVYGFGHRKDCKDHYIDIALVAHVVESLSTCNYKNALELLNNAQEFPHFAEMNFLNSGNDIKAIKVYITYLINQDANYDIDLWKQAAKEVNDENSLLISDLFYSSFEIIFRALNNRKYFKKCLKYLENLYKQHKRYIKLAEFYYRTSMFYWREGNYIKSKNCIITAHTIFSKNEDLIVESIQTIMTYNNIICSLILYYEGAEQAKLFDECKYCYKKYKKQSKELLIISRLYIGIICFNMMKLEDAWKYLKNAENEIKKSKAFYQYLSSIYLYQGKILSEWKNYKFAIQKLNNAKRIIEMTAFKYNFEITRLIIDIAEVYFKWNWCDDSLIYFEDAKDRLLKAPWYFNQGLFWKIDKYIGLIYEKKGEKKKSLEIFERLYLDISNSKPNRLWPNYEIVDLSCMIVLWSIDLENFEKVKYHTEICLKYLNSYEYQRNPVLVITICTAWLCYYQNEYSLCESICKNALKFHQFDNAYCQVAIRVNLLPTYLNQNKYKESEEIIEYLQSHMNQIENDWFLRIKIYNIFSKVFSLREDFDKAEYYIREAEKIIDKYLKAEINEKVIIYNSLGNIYEEMNRLEESEIYFNKALNIYLNINSDFRITSSICYKLARLYRIKNDWKNCKDCLLKAIKFCEEKYPNNYDYKGFLGWLVYVCKKDNDHACGMEHWYKLKKFVQNKNPNFKGLELTEYGKLVTIIDLNNY